MKSLSAKQPKALGLSKPAISKKSEPRAKQASRLDRVFVWLVKAGSLPGSLLYFPILPIWAFISGGLVYHYEVNGAYGSLALLICLLGFCFTIYKLTTLENKFRVRRLSQVYFGSVLGLLLITLGLELWLFKTF